MYNLLLLSLIFLTNLSFKEWGAIITIIVLPLATWFFNKRWRKAQLKKTESELAESEVEVQIKVDQYNDKKWQKMKETNEKLTDELHEIRTQFYEAEERHRIEFNKIAERLRKAELKNVELTAELTLYKTVRSS